jgi:hypothetical protein
MLKLKQLNTNKNRLTYVLLDDKKRVVLEKPKRQEIQSFVSSNLFAKYYTTSVKINGKIY